MLEVICGGMFAGKSELLIHRLKRASYANKNIIAFKPAMDNRYSVENIATHSGHFFDSIPLQYAADIMRHIKDTTEVVGIDEAQFFDSGIIAAVEMLIARGIDVYVAGLDLDSYGKPFGSMPYLLSLADKVSKVSAVCMKCGADATRSQRIAKTKGQVLIGGNDAYEARCRKCWKPS